MKIIIRIMVASTLLISGLTYAAGSEDGAISPGWYIYPDGNILFDLSGVHTSSQLCSQPERWGFDTTTPVGRSYYSAFLMAYASGKRVSIVGAGNCGIHGNTEPVSEFYVH